MESTYYSRAELNKYHKDNIKFLKKREGETKDLGWFIRITKNGTSLISRYWDYLGEVKEYSLLL